MNIKGARAVGGGEPSDTSLPCYFNSRTVLSMRCCKGYLMSWPWQAIEVPGQKGVRSAPSNHGDNVNNISICPERGWCERNHIKSKKTQIK